MADTVDFEPAYYRVNLSHTEKKKMKSLIIGLLIIAAAAFMIVPTETAGFGLGWKTNVVDFLKGGVPVFAIVVGIIAVLIGIADMKDRAEAKKDAAEKKD
jgi:type IV secretory pathway VirB2 component (pilin)